MNVFMRNSPEFRSTLNKMDQYYEQNARNHGIFPDWPIISLFNDFKALYYQMCFMKGQDRYFSKMHEFAWNAYTNNSARKGYDPGNPIYGWLVAYWDRCQCFISVLTRITLKLEWLTVSWQIISTPTDITKTSGSKIKNMALVTASFFRKWVVSNLSF